MVEVDSIHNSIILRITDSMAIISKEYESDINDVIEDLTGGRVPSAGQACINHIRSVRANVLKHYQPIKTEIFNNISDAIISENKTHVLTTLQELTEKINEQDANIAKAQEDKRRIIHDIESLSDYQMFMLYGESDEQGVRKESKIRTIDDVIQTQKKYIFKRNWGFIIGTVIAILCAGMDYSIIYSVFLSSNLSLGVAILTAIISAAILDLPPYILGIVWTKRDDVRRTWELRNEGNEIGKEIELRKYKITIMLLFLAILLIFGAYMLLRIFLFLGGGDFNLALHLLIKKDFEFENIIFNSSDLISTFVPVGTSVMAFAIGMLTSTSYTDYIKKTVLVIKNGLQEHVNNLDKTIVECNEKRKNLIGELEISKQESWTYYFGNALFPKEDVVFRQKISNAYQQLNLQVYRQTYKECSILLRHGAERALEQINAVLVKYVANQGDITSMTLSKTEENILDEFWVVSDNNFQRKTTSNHIKAIEDLISELGQLR